MKLIEIFGYDHPYVVNDEGRVYNKGRMNKPLRLIPSKGYYRSRLIKNGKIKLVYNHRLVAENFLQNPPSQAYDVNHINGLKNDNRLENLEWVTRKGNVHHYHDLIIELKREYITLQRDISELNRELDLLKQKKAAML